MCVLFFFKTGAFAAGCCVDAVLGCEDEEEEED